MIRKFDGLLEFQECNVVIDSGSIVVLVNDYIFYCCSVEMLGFIVVGGVMLSYQNFNDLGGILHTVSGRDYI